MSSDDSPDDTREYVVVANEEDQYSIWPVDREIPTGWAPRGPRGSRATCLEHIESVWTDMRPRSLRLWLAEQKVESEQVTGAQPSEG